MRVVYLSIGFVTGNSVAFPVQALVEAMEVASTSSATLASMDLYRVPLPSDLDPNSPTVSITFCSTSSRPVVCNGLSKVKCSELLGNLLTSIFENFRACAGPETYFARADQSQTNKNEFENQEQKVILVGASNLKYSSGYFT